MELRKERVIWIIDPIWMNQCFYDLYIIEGRKRGFEDVRAFRNKLIPSLICCANTFVIKILFSVKLNRK